MRHLQKSGIITLKALGGPIGSRTAPVQEQQLEETKFIAFFMGKKIDIDGKDLYDAKQKAITQLKVPKSKVGLLAVVSAESQRNQDFKFEIANEEVVNEAFSDNKNLNYIMKGKKIKNVVYDDNIGFAIILDNGKYIRFDTHSAKPGMVKDLKMESVNEGKKVFKVNPPIGSSKYSISSHNGTSTHNDGSDFYDIKIFKNKVDLEKGIKDYKSKGFVEEAVNEENPGLWANIRAKQARGEAPAPKNSKAYKDAVEAGDKIKNEQSIKREALKSIVKEVMQEEAEYQKFFQKVLDKAGKSIPSMSDDEKKAFFNKVDSAWNGRGEKNESVVNEEALPKDGSTIKINNIPVKIEYVSNRKYIGYSWKGKNNKENYEETKVSNHSNLNSLIKAIKVNLAESVIKEGIWPKSKLSGQFQMQLSLQLKKHFKGVFYSVGYDLYHNDKKILTIDGDEDSINSVVAKLKKIVKESVVNEGIVNEGIGTIAIGIMLAWAGLKVLKFVAKKLFAGIGSNMELTPERLKRATVEMIKSISNETNIGASFLMGHYLTKLINTDIDSGKIKTINDIEKAMRNYLNSNDSVK